MTLKKVANWFHDREGELFTVDETPFTREEIVQVVNDSVDPVQQVMVDGDKYIGVISYDEHDGWYEYTRWDDAAGEVNMGVCAKCVAEASSVDEVSRTIGDNTDIAKEKFENHYLDEHTVKPDEIETGATLLSGTTINSNEAIHPGMDGTGSGVDADFVKGNEALQTGSFFSFSEGQVVNKYSSPNTQPKGLSFDSSESIWHSDSNSVSIYRLNKSVSVLDSFSSPSSNPAGVGVESNDCIWVAGRGSDSIFEVDRTGTLISQISSPNSGPEGLDFNSSDSIWNSDTTNDSIYKINKSGTIQTGFSGPSGNPRGVGVDNDDSVWNVDRFAQSVYKLNESGTVQTKFSAPCSFPNGLSVEDSSSIWLADQTADSIYQLTQSEFIQF